MASPRRDSVHPSAVLQPLWDVLAVRLVGEEPRAQPFMQEWRDRLMTLYSEPHRHYHTLTHVSDLLAQLHEHRELARDMVSIELAIWFHDAVYAPTAAAGDNERSSARLFEQFARKLRNIMGPFAMPLLLEEKIQAISSWIEETARHTTTPLRSRDSDLFLDLDLAVLGRSPHGYDMYARQIRREYSFVPAEVYRAKRAAVLEKFLKCEALYKTPQLREELEEQARENLARELARLRDPAVPLLE